MKKHSVLFKLAAMCLAVVMLVSTFGIAAYAADCNHFDYDWSYVFDEDGNIKFSYEGHAAKCANCGAEYVRPHDIEYWYKGTDDQGHEYHALECNECPYVEAGSEAVCSFSPTYDGIDSNHIPYHVMKCVCGNRIEGTEEACDLQAAALENAEGVHVVTCTTCDTWQYERCVWGEWSYYTTADKKVIDVDQHHLFCEGYGKPYTRDYHPACGQVLKSEPHDFEWESKGDQTLFKGNTMVRTCWCGYKDIPANAEILWQQAKLVGGKKLVSADDLSYLHQFGLWVAGSGLFILRVAFEPVRWVVNLFYHMDIFD